MSADWSLQAAAVGRVARRALLLLTALPAWVRALDFGFQPPPDPDDPQAPARMRDLAERIVPVYQDADSDAFLSNMTALQIVSGAHRAASGSNQTLRGRQQGKPFDALAARALLDGMLAQAHGIAASTQVGFATAFARAFQQALAPLDNAQAAAVIARLDAPLAQFRMPVQQAFERWRAQGRLPQDDAVALVRDWLEYQSRKSLATQLPALIAADQHRRYVTQDDLRIPVRPGVVLQARLVRPAGTPGPRATLLRFALDPDEHDAQRSAVLGFAGLTAYVRGRAADGSGAAWPFVHDGDDAVAVMTWITRQPWSDGRVAMLGDGYSGYTAWAAARRKPAALKAIATIAAMAPGVDFPMAGQIYRNAMVRWAVDHASGAPRPTDAVAGASVDAAWQARDLRWYQGKRPYWDIDRVLLGQRNAFVRTWLTHPSHDRYWRKFLPTAQQYAQIDIPVLSIAGYYGGAAGALHYHQEHLRHRPQAAHQLLIGPYDAHALRHGGTVAQLRGLTLEPAARVDLAALRLQWLAHILNGAPRPALLQDRVNLQLMGANAWRYAPQLHAADRSRLRLYLDPRARDDGAYRLSPSASAGGDPAPLVVDLADRRDARLPWPDALQSAQLPLRNAIRFVSEPLAEDTEIDGSLSGMFDITPSRQDVDLSLALYAQTDSGAFQLLFEPYDFRASYAGHRTQRRLLRAGMRQQLPFTTERVTACRLAAGSRLVLVLAIHKRADRQINYGSGKDVNSETIADAVRPMRVRWFGGSYVEMQRGGG